MITAKMEPRLHVAFRASLSPHLPAQQVRFVSRYGKIFLLNGMSRFVTNVTMPAFNPTTKNGGDLSAGWKLLQSAFLERKINRGGE